MGATERGSVLSQAKPECAIDIDAINKRNQHWERILGRNPQAEIERPAPAKSVLSVDQKIYDYKLEASNPTNTFLRSSSMSAEPSDVTQGIQDAFRAAPKNSIKKFVTDFYSKWVTEGRIKKLAKWLPWQKKEVEKDAQASEAMFNEFATIPNTSVDYVHPATSWKDEFFPMTNRLHAKGTEVLRPENSVFYFHTFNHESPVGKADFAVKHEGRIALELSDRLTKIIEAKGPFRNIVWPIDNHETLYVDGGERVDGKVESVILKKAIDLINNSKNIVLCSYMFPDGKIADALDQAGKEKRLRQILTSTILEKIWSKKFWKQVITDPFHIDNIMWAVDLLNRGVAKLKGQQFPIVQNPFGAMHAKLMIGTDKTTGKRWAFYGSHNLSKKGVDAGTAEWQIFTTDSITVKNLEKWYGMTAQQMKHAEGEWLL